MSANKPGKWLAYRLRKKNKKKMILKLQNEEIMATREGRWIFKETKSTKVNRWMKNGSLK